MPSGEVGGYVGVSTVPSTENMKGKWNMWDYAYWKRRDLVPGVEKNNVPAGCLFFYAGTTSPDAAKYSICNGSTISRTTYATLYAVIGDTFGAGDGSNTFEVPDLTDHLLYHKPSSVGVDATISVSAHDHGNLSVYGGYSQSGTTADADNNLKGANNSGYLSASGSATSKFRDHTLLPLITLKKTNLPPGAIIYSFRDPTVSWGDNGTFLKCNAQNVSRSTYDVLFGIISTNYGAGDGASTFGMPDLRGCFPKGLKTFDGSSNYSADAYPEHTHGTFATYTGNESNYGSRQNPSGSDCMMTGPNTTPSSGIGNGNEFRGANFAAHAFISAAAIGDPAAGDLIFYLGGATAPENYASLNGTTVAKAAYADLDAAIEDDFIDGSNIDIIDVRDKYLRGTDLGAARDPDAAARAHGGTSNATGANISGTTQAEALTAHTHGYYSTGNCNNRNPYGPYNDIPYRYAQTNPINTSNLTVTYNSNNQTVTNAASIQYTKIKVNVCMRLVN